MKAGWAEISLGDVCIKITDGSHNPPKGVEPSKYLMLSSKNVFDDSITLDKPRYLTREAFEIENRRTDVNPGDILLTVVGTIGRAAIVPKGFPKVTLQRSVGVLKPDTNLIESRYLMFALHSILDVLLDGARGVAQKGIYLKTLRKIHVPLPPLDEQKRIVAVLDAVFDGLNRARAHAEANLQNARELFESGLEEAFERGRKIWPEHTVDDIGIVQTGSTPKTSDERNYGSFLPFIKPAHFNLDGSLTYNVEGLSEQGAAQSRLVSSNSVLMVCIGATIGKVGYSTRDVATNQQINSLSPKDGVLNKFIYFQMRSKSFQDSVLLKSGQATLPIINKSKWSSLGVFVPEDLQEQKDVSEKLDGLLAVSHEIADQYQQKIADIDNLRQSLLQKAFAGELT